MSNAKFTKGPWYRANFSVRSALVGKFVAHTDNNSIESEERAANASLIAASPEMYGILDRISDGLLDAGGYSNCALAKEIESLLSKARGES